MSCNKKGGGTKEEITSNRMGVRNLFTDAFCRTTQNI